MRWPACGPGSKQVPRCLRCPHPAPTPLTATTKNPAISINRATDDPRDCIVARGRLCVGTIWEKGGEIKTAKFQV